MCNYILNLFLLVGSLAPLGAEKKTPNVLFIVCDDLNTHISPWGYEHIETPALERLAAESVRFRRAFCQYPVCGPSRASFLSGLYPESTGILNNSADIREERPGTITMPQFFKENGYWTASVGKVFHNADNEHGDIAWNEHVRFVNDELPIVTAARKKFENERGSVEKPANRKAWRELRKDVLVGIDSQTPPGYGRSGLTDEQHKDGKNARQVVEWLEDEPYGDKPFIIALGIHKPHVAFLAPENYFDMYPVEEIVYAADDPDLWESLPSTAKSNRYGAFGFELGKEKDALRREYMQAYHACITFVDTQLRLVLDALKDSGQWEDTIIVFTSDHGYHLGDHFLWGKVSLFDIGAKVPFMIRTPGLSRKGASSEAMVELIDIFPTLADLSGLEIPDHLQGQSLRPLLSNPGGLGNRDYAYSVVTRGKNLGYSLRDQKWRYGKWPDGEELYDLNKDPNEKRNLAGNPEYEGRLKDFRQTLSAKQQMAASQRH